MREFDYLPTHIVFTSHKVEIADYKLLRLIYFIINKLSNLMLKNILTNNTGCRFYTRLSEYICGHYYDIQYYKFNIILELQIN